MLPEHPAKPGIAVAIGSLAGMSVNCASAKLLVFKR
jgi:hypothetical protein